MAIHGRWSGWAQLASFVVLAIGLGAPVAHAAEWPRGWAVERKPDGLVLTPAGQADVKNVMLVAEFAVPTKQPLREWFDAKIAGLSADGMTMSQRQGISSEGSLLKDGWVLRGKNPPVRVWAFAYATKAGHQLMLLLSPLDLSDQDSRLSAALDSIADKWRAAEPAQAGAAPAAQSAASPAPAAQPARGRVTGNGARCREEMRTVTVMATQMSCQPRANGVPDCQMRTMPTQQQQLQQVCD